MEFICYEVNAPRAGITAVVTLKGVASNVLLMDRQNLDRFRRGSSYQYRGGFYKRSPARLSVPAGEWYIVVLPVGGRVETSLRLL